MRWLVLIWICLALVACQKSVVVVGDADVSDPIPSSSPSPTATPTPTPTPPLDWKGREQAARQKAAEFIAAQSQAHVHSEDVHKADEHEAALDLVEFSDVTHTAFQSGNLSDPEIWFDKRVPTAGARIWILPGVKVVVENQSSPAFETIRVTGELAFNPDATTRLTVHTIVVDPMGKFTMGTAERPIQRGKTAMLRFRTERPFDREKDPLALGLGLIAHGTTQIFGSPVMPYVALETQPRRGDTQLHTAQPVDWKVGDEIVVMSTRYCGNPCLPQEEARTIQAISIDRRNLTLSLALEFDHRLASASEVSAEYGGTPPLPNTMRVFVANTTRNAKLSSVEIEPDRRGHFMQMHKGGARIHFAEFRGLGRSQKAIPVDDPQLDEHGRLIAGTGTNPRGRYPVHFHHNGIDIQGTPSDVNGISIVGSPGWGLVNHESFVHVRNSVSYDVVGAHYVAESGTEIGSFIGNVAMKAIGTGKQDRYVMRREILDFGVVGHGFWLHSAGPEVRGNLVTGTNSMAYVYYPWEVLKDRDGNVFRFPAKNLRNPAWAGSREWVRISEVPIAFQDNTAIGVFDGLRLYGMLPVSPHLIDRLSVQYSHTFGVGADYSHRFTIRNSMFIGNGPGNGGAFYIDIANDTHYENNYIVGYRVGPVLGIGGNNSLRGGYLNNRTNVVIGRFGNREHNMRGQRNIVIEGVRMGRLTRAQLGLWPQQYDIEMTSALVRDNALRPPSTWFHPEKILYEGKQLFYKMQAPDFVVTGSGSLAIDGLTNAQISARYSLALAGSVASADARPDTWIHDGLVGSQVTPHLAPLISWLDVQPDGLGDLQGYAFDPARNLVGFRFKIPAAEKISEWNVTNVRDTVGELRPLLFR
jgi:hypothetical protein